MNNLSHHQVLVNATHISKNTGIYSYIMGLFNALDKIPNQYDFLFRIPRSKKHLFGDNKKTFIKSYWCPRGKLPKQDASIYYFPFQFFKWSDFKNKDMRKMILTVHDLNFFYEFDNASKEFYRIRNQMQERIDHAKKIISISHYTKNDLVEKLSVDPKKIEVIHNGFSLQSFPHFKNPKYKPKRPFIFSLGSRRNKNVHTLPALLLGNDYELVLGRLKPFSSYGQYVKNIAKKWGVEQRVKMLGSIDEEEKYWYYKNSLAYVSPSLNEGFGLTVLESMSLGKPVFLSKCTSLPEVGGKHAYYFDNFDAEHMQKVFYNGMNDYEMHPNKKIEIENWTKQFSWDSAAEKILQLFNSM